MIIVNCKSFQALFSEYYDDCLPKEVPRAVVEAHLKECAICAAEYKKYAQILDEVQNLPDVDIPPGFHESLMEYVNARKHDNAQSVTRRKRTMLYKIAPVVAVAASLVMVLWVTGVLGPSVTNNYTTEFAPVAHYGIQQITPNMAELPNETALGRARRDLGDFEIIEGSYYEEVEFTGVARERLYLGLDSPPVRRNIILVIVICLVTAGFVAALVFAIKKKRSHKKL